MIRVLVAEDTGTVRELLVAILESDPEFSVVGQARTGREAVDLACELRPDVVTMDIQMPELDGLDATKEIMIAAPTRIIIVSSGGSGNVELALSATRAGALMVLPSPVGPGAPEYDRIRTQLLRAVRAMAEVKVVRRWAAKPAPSAPPAPPLRTSDTRPRVVVMAASTGGPAALQRILMDLPRDFPVPILIVQHIATGFAEGLCTWLAGSCDLRVRLAREGTPTEPSTVYLAPDDRHLGIGGDGCVVLDGRQRVGGFRPSADFLFESAARGFGREVAAVILTGMGRDGVEGLRAVHAVGGHVLAQDEATSVVHGMPGAAVQAGVVDSMLPLNEIAARLVQLVTRKGR